MFEKTARENLLAIADAYASAMGLAESTVSSRFHGKSWFLEKFRSAECSVTMSTYQAMLQKFSDEWPQGKPWPKLKPIPLRRLPRTKVHR